jgi:hypothetical protein
VLPFRDTCSADPRHVSAVSLRTQYGIRRID